MTFFPIDSYAYFERTDFVPKGLFDPKLKDKLGEKRVKPDPCMLMGLTAEEADKCKLGNKVTFVFHSLSGIGEVEEPFAILIRFQTIFGVYCADGVLHACYNQASYRLRLIKKKKRL